jgi:hypothetical protein
MSMEIVNGYVCQSCSDVSLAKKGVNPAHPKDDPANPAYDAKTAKADKAQDTGVAAPVAKDSAKAVTTPPSATSSAPGYVSATASSQNATPYSPGNLLNVSA